MELGIEGKRALVTGASRGIGKAIALALAKEGAKVAVFARDASQIADVVKEMGGYKNGHMGGDVDLEVEGSPHKMLMTLDRADFGDIDIVVHNLGGTLDIRNPLCNVQDWRRVMRVNFEVAVDLNVRLIPAMQKKHWGRVVHIGSTASVENNGPVTYCTSKAALAAYSRCLGRVLAPDGIVMTAILPGAIFTEDGSWDVALKERPEHVRKYLEERLPLKDFGTPENIAGMVTFLCSDQAEFMQGAIIPVDGGQVRGYFV